MQEEQREGQRKRKRHGSARDRGMEEGRRKGERETARHRRGEGREQKPMDTGTEVRVGLSRWRKSEEREITSMERERERETKEEKGEENSQRIKQ